MREIRIEEIITLLNIWNYRTLTTRGKKSGTVTVKCIFEFIKYNIEFQ